MGNPPIEPTSAYHSFVSGQAVVFGYNTSTMAMISYNEVKPGVAVLIEGEPYVCTWNNIMKKQQRRPVNQTKMRHIIKGNSIEYSFQQSDKVEEAEIESRPAVFIYERNGEWFFHDVKDKSKRFTVTDDAMGGS